MAKIILASWMIRYPLGGNLSWALQQLLGYMELGHDIYLVERCGYEDSCYDPVKKVMSNDGTYGMKVVDELLCRFGLAGKWCFVDWENNYHGLSRKALADLFRSADLFIDTAPDGSWTEEAAQVALRVLIDGEPGFSQITIANRGTDGAHADTSDYDYYYTNGKNVGRPGNPVPDLGIQWGHVYSPVVTGLFGMQDVESARGYTTIMNWQSHRPVAYRGKVFGQKDVEFQQFISLPKKVPYPLEVAVSGAVPKELLIENGWRLEPAQEITASYKSFCDYVAGSRGEFSVCKNVFVANRTGWFSDKSAVYLACGRPVVLQDTGFSDHLPVGEGLFAVNNVDEAMTAIEEIERNYKKHARVAFEIACEHLEAKKTLGTFLSEIGI